MRFEAEIALRYLKSSRKSIFMSITTTIAITAISLSVSAILITLSIINGFQYEIRQKIMDLAPEITIYGEMSEKEISRITTTLSTIKGIKKYSPFIISQAILITPTRNLGCVIKGIDTPEEFDVVNLHRTLKYGSWELGKDGIVLGEELAKNLGVFIGDDVIIVSPEFKNLSLGIIPRMKKFKLKGIINTGYYEYDSSFAFIDINAAHSFFNQSIKANGISIKTNDTGKVFEIYKELKSLIPFYFSIKTYADINKNLFSALKLEKFVMTLILSLIILIATFSISSHLFMMTLNKSKEIGILRAIGSSGKSIRKIFLFAGIYISSIGITIGMTVGSIALFVIKKYKIIELPSDIYYITKVPVKTSFTDILMIITVSFILTIISSLIPANKASKIDPVAAIRYN